MKRISTSIAKYVCIAACVLLAAACSSDSATDLQTLIGDKADMAVMLSQDKLVKSLDFKDGKLPEDLVVFNNSVGPLLKLKGYDTERMLLLSYDKGNAVGLVSRITDKAALKSSLDEAGFDQSASAYVNHSAKLSVVLRDGFCWLTFSDQGAGDKVQRMCKESSSTPAAAWKIEKLNTLNESDIYGLANLDDSFSLFSATFKGSKVSGVFILLDQEGNPMIDMGGKTNTDLSTISNFVDREASFGLVIAGVKSLPNVTAALQASGNAELADLLTGRAAVNLQILDPNAASVSNFSNYAAQVVLEAQPGKAEQLLEYVATRLEAETGMRCTGSGTHRQLGNFFVKVSLDVEDNFVVARYGKTTIKQSIATGDNDGQYLWTFVNIPVGFGPLQQELFGIHADIKADSDHFTYELEYTNSKKNFLHCTIAFCSWFVATY